MTSLFSRLFELLHAPREFHGHQALLGFTDRARSVLGQLVRSGRFDRGDQVSFSVSQFVVGRHRASTVVGRLHLLNS